jgi:addiction module RelE/StbE family toxin
MWRIEEHRRVDKQSTSAPKEILKRYEKWQDIAALSGPLGLRAITGFHDEALSGQWKGYRSSCLGLQYRVIYRVHAAELLFRVEAITPHDYRRP